MMDLKMEVYSPFLELLGFLEIQRSVIWAEKAFSSGSFSVDSLITSESLALLQPENIIWIEGETAGIIEYVQQQAGKDGPYITVKGPDLTGILGRRILWGLYNLKGTPPAIMHQLVNDCCVTPTRGAVEARKIPGLVLLDPPAGGDSIQIQKTGGTLLEELELLGETYGVAFGVRFNPAVPQMEFWTRWGKNRSIHQTTNMPVLYSAELDDVLSSDYFYNSQDYRNVSLVAGEGEGSDRVYVTVEEDVESIPDVPVPPAPPDPPVVEKYTVTLLVDPASGGIASGGKTVASGVNITVTAAPSDGYKFDRWQENGVTVSTDMAYTFTVTGDRTLTAVFSVIVPTYTVTVSIDPAGSGTVTGAGQYQAGESVTVTAAPEDGYTFSKWQMNGQNVGKNAAYTFILTGDVELVAVFEEATPSRLPAGYTEVEYIESLNCYFDTGYSLTQRINTIMDVAPLDAPTTTRKMFLYSYATGVNQNYNLNYMIAYSTYGIQGRSGMGNLAYVTGKTNPTTERVLLELDYYNKKFVVDSSSFSTANNDLRTTTPKTVYLLGYSDTATTHARLYSCKIYNYGSLIRDFVPCINPSGEVGLYDSANLKFYSKSGTGTLTPGPAV